MATSPTKPTKTSPRSPLNGGIISLVVVVVIIVAVLIGHKASKSDSSMSMPATSGTTSSSTANATATDQVMISNYAFTPSAITVKVGTTVTWTNQDAVEHTVTSDSGKELDSALLPRDMTFTHTFDKAGTYTYHCTPHTYMKATVIVTN